MRRSTLLKVSVYCPHFKRPVVADKNTAIDRLVDCADKDSCRESPAPSGAPSTTCDPARPFPHGCPVYPQLAK